MIGRTRLVATALALAFSAPSTVLAHDGDPKMLDRQPMYPGKGWRNAQLLQAIAGGGAGGAAGGTMALGAPSFPHNNTTLLAWLSLPDFGVPSGGNGNSIYGYVSPSGREYAIMGLSTGTAFVEITQPGNPVIVAQIAGPSSLWRDMRVYSHYCYAGSEGGGGIQVMDLINIDSGVVSLVGSVTTGGSTATHTLAINTDSGYLYRDGGSTNGLRIYNLNVTPQSPQYVGAWSARYVHEAQVVTYPTGGPGGGPRELAICCGGLNSGQTDVGIDIVDVTNHASPVSLLHLGYGSPGFSHQAWLSPDRQFLYHNDETDGRPFTRIFDASNLNSATPSLTYVTEFQNGVTVDHNLYTRGNYLYESNYRSGLRVFDRTNPVAPTLYANFDTYPEDDNTGYNGMWNNYPYFPSGIVVCSDIERGLFVIWVGTPLVALQPIGGAPTALNPAGQTLLVNLSENTPGAYQTGTAQLHYDIGAGYVTQSLNLVSGTVYSAIFPPVACGTEVSYYFTAQSTNGVVWTSPEAAPSNVYTATAAFGSSTIVSTNFETAAGWTSGAAGDNATTGLWTRVNPNGTAAQTEDDHSTVGTLCWVTGQGTAGGASGDADVDGGRTTLLSPAFDLTTASGPTISYWRWYSNNQGGDPGNDTFRVDISNNNGTSWVNAETVGPNGAGTTGGWISHTLRVTDYVALTTQVRLRFVAEDAGAGSVIEAAIDDFSIQDTQCFGSASYCLGDGTAGACPCGNYGFSGGCANSNGNGASLDPTGTASVAADSFVLNASGMPATVSALFFQGNNADNGGLGTAFGDGLRCATGSIVRFGTKITVGGATSYPEAGDVSISVRAAIPSGATRYYQSWYRNAAAFCTPQTFNLTNGVSVIWAP